jgi:hypothetical protein
MSYRIEQAPTVAPAASSPGSALLGITSVLPFRQIVTFCSSIGGGGGGGGAGGAGAGGGGAGAGGGGGAVGGG